MFDALIIVSFCIFFLYVWNKTLVGEKLRNFLAGKIPEKCFYALGCPVCLPFWTAVFLCILGILLIKFIAVVALLTFVGYSIMSLFDKLNE